MNPVAVISILERSIAVLDLVTQAIPELKEAAGDKLDLLEGAEDALKQQRKSIETLKLAAEEGRDVTGAELDESEEAARGALDRLRAALGET